MGGIRPPKEITERAMLQVRAAVKLPESLRAEIIQAGQALDGVAWAVGYMLVDYIDEMKEVTKTILERNNIPPAHGDLSPTDMTQRAVVKEVAPLIGKGESTIHRWIFTARNTPQEMKEKYGVLPFSHFTFAASNSAAITDTAERRAWQEKILRWSLENGVFGKPFATLAQLRAKFVEGLPVEAHNIEARIEKEKEEAKKIASISRVIERDGGATEIARALAENNTPYTKGPQKTTSLAGLDKVVRNLEDARQWVRSRHAPIQVADSLSFAITQLIIWADSISKNQEDKHGKV